MERFLGIGGITIGVVFRDPRLHVPVSGAIGKFVLGSATPDLTVHVSRLAQLTPPSGPLLFDSGMVWRLFEDGFDHFRIECRSELFGEEPYKIARIDRSLSHADVEVRIVGDHVPDALEFPLDELLVNALLTRRGGIEVHACGVIDEDGSGYLFAGNSGDGKTTTARLWMKSGARIVSDDRVILRREHDRWWMYGTPWHGEANISLPERAPLRHVFLLERSGSGDVSQTSADALPAAAAMARLLACAFPPFHDRSGLASVVETLAQLVAEVATSRFSFVNDERAIDFVRHAARGRA